MAHTFTMIFIHAVFSTKGRKSFLSPDVRQRLFPYMGGIIRDLKGSAILINGVEDHVHVLASLPSTVALSDFMKELKGVSSGWVTDTFALPERFAWQTGYAAFSVSKSNVQAVREYIEKQEEHHRLLPFQEEYLALLNRHDIAYDSRFVFDQDLAE